MKLPRYLKAEQMRRLLEAPSRERARDRIILRLLGKCGLRVSEVSKLRIEDIDFKEELIAVRDSKGGKDRVVPVDKVTLDLIEFYKGDSEHGTLILSRKGKGLSVRQIQYLVGRYAKQVGMPQRVTPHMLRHSFAVHSLNQGMNIRSLQKILGHSSLTTTQIYLDLTSKDVKEDYKRHPLPY